MVTSSRVKRQYGSYGVYWILNSSITSLDLVKVNSNEQLSFASRTHIYHTRGRLAFINIQFIENKPRMFQGLHAFYIKHKLSAFSLNIS